MDLRHDEGVGNWHFDFSHYLDTLFFIVLNYVQIWTQYPPPHFYCTISGFLALLLRKGGSMKKIGAIFALVLALFATAVWLAYRDLEQEYKYLD